MINVKKLGVVLEKTGLEFENEGVLNPATIYHDGFIHMFYRSVRKGNNSTISYCRLDGPMNVVERMSEPFLVPEHDYEKQGVEDPRITKIDNEFYMTYTAYDGANALGALAISSDLVSFEKKGLIVPQMTFEEFRHLVDTGGGVNKKYYRFNRSNPMLWDKNVIFFPRRINGKLYMLHRVKPDIQIVSVNDLSELTETFWQQFFLNLENNIVMRPRYSHEVSYIGGGCTPIETAEGWLVIYHGVHDTTKGYVYTACAALLDLNDPAKEISRLPYPLFFPENEWELSGEVNNVCFPSGAVVIDEMIYIYYGAADERIACASVSIKELIDELLIINN